VWRIPRLVAEIENSRFKFLSSKWRTIVVLPAPDGAENMMSLPCIKEFKVPDSKFQVKLDIGYWKFNIGHFALKYV